MKTTFLFLRPRDAALQSSRTSGTQLGPQRPSVRLYQADTTDRTGRTAHAQRSAAAKAKALRTTCQKCANKMRGVCEWPQFASDAPRFQIVATTHRIGTGRSLMGIHTRLPDTRGISHISHHRVPHGPLQECHPLICHAVDARPLAFRTQRSARNSTLVLMARTRSTTTDPSRPSPSSPREPARSQCCGPRAGQAS